MFEYGMYHLEVKNKIIGNHQKTMAQDYSGKPAFVQFKGFCIT